jgi:hypothetical protein
MAKLKATMMALTLAFTVLTAVPSFAGDILAFKTALPTRTLAAGGCVWITAGSLSVNAPRAGYVVVTASGMAYFNSISASSLTLTLGRNPAAAGVWKYTLSPGLTPYQTYNLQMVFKVQAGPQNFFLNAASCDGDGRVIGVQTGSFTAEFYPNGSVQENRTAPAPQAETGSEPADIQINK